jgi:indolepyruvate ferredoxin oxidoreductase beta subunit
MDTVNLIISGLGGQGILFMTKILAQAALAKGLNVMGAETHGMAQRGGSVVSHLRLGDVEGSLVGTGQAHFLLALEENEAYRNIPFLTREGSMYVNASDDSFPRQEVKTYLDKIGAAYQSVPAEKVATELGAPRSSNLALLGFFTAFCEGPITYEELRKTIDQISPDRLKTINLKVFDTGFQKGNKRKRFAPI